MLKFIKIFILFIPIIFTIGCNQIILKDKEPKTITEDPMTLEAPSENPSPPIIKGFKSITQGTISDVSSDGNDILLLKQDTTNIENLAEDETSISLSIYDLEEGRFNSTILTQPNVFLGKFDRNEKGSYYLENTDDSTVSLYWTNNNGDKKIKISSSNDYMNPSFYINSDNDVYYGSKEGLIVRTNKEKERVTINIGEKFNLYDIRQVYPSIDEDYIIFSASKDDSFNVYQLDLEDKKLHVLIENITGGFSLSTEEDQLLYIGAKADSNKRVLGLLDLNTLKSTIISEGFTRRATFSPNGDKIAYLDSVDQNTDLQNIWIYDVENQATKQVASNLKIIGDIFWNPRVENQLLFSTYEVQDNNLQSTTHSLDFE